MWVLKTVSYSALTVFESSRFQNYRINKFRNAFKWQGSVSKSSSGESNWGQASTDFLSLQKKFQATIGIFETWHDKMPWKLKQMDRSYHACNFFTAPPFWLHGSIVFYLYFPEIFLGYWPLRCNTSLILLLILQLTIHSCLLKLMITYILRVDAKLGGYKRFMRIYGINNVTDYKLNIFMRSWKHHHQKKRRKMCRLFPWIPLHIV